MSKPTTPVPVGYEEMTSSVSATTGEPFVLVHWYDTPERNKLLAAGQLSPAEAEAKGIGMIQAAMAARHDAACAALLRETFEVADDVVAMFVHGLRLHRWDDDKGADDG